MSMILKKITGGEDIAQGGDSPLRAGKIDPNEILNTRGVLTS